MKKQMILLVMILILFSCIAVTIGETPTFDVQNINDGVNLYTGDFRFENSLMKIPGRGGLDYDLMLVYQAGISENQESSTIGLGWDLNIDSIKRSVVGVPDDYCGGCLNEQSNYQLYHKLNPSSFSFTSAILESIANPQNFMALASGQWPLVLFNVMPRALSSGVENQIKVNCDGWCDLHVNGFKWYDVNQQGLYAEATKPLEGQQESVLNKEALTNDVADEENKSLSSALSTDVYYGFDINMPDLYTLSGNYLNGQLILSNYPGLETTPSFHFEKTSGHATDQVDMDLCAGDNSRCQDALLVDYITDSTNHEFSKIRIVNKDGSEYIFKPTKRYVNPGTPNYAMLTRRSLFPQVGCTYSDSDYTEVKLLKRFTYEFGVSEIHSSNYFDSNQNGYADDSDEGNWIKFSYANTLTNYKRVNPYDETCIEGPDGRKTLTESYQEISYPQTIETPTHYAEFVYAWDRTDSKESGGSRHPPRLSKIQLFSKTDPSTVLESQEFKQNFFLMPGTPDSLQGRLTLVNVTKYGLGESSNLPPIKFNYGGNLLCGDGICNYGETCISCHSDCQCGFDDWTVGYKFGSSGYCSSNPGYWSQNCAYNAPVARNVQSWVELAGLTSHWIGSDSHHLIDGDQSACGCPVDWKFITWVWSNETFVKNMQLAWDDDYLIEVWKNCGETFNEESCVLQKFCDNTPGAGTWNPTFTRGWNVVQVNLINDVGACRAYLFDNIAKALSNDERLWIMDGVGIDQYEDSSSSFVNDVSKDYDPNAGLIINEERSLLSTDPVEPKIQFDMKKDRQEVEQEEKEDNLITSFFPQWGVNSYNPSWGKYKFDRWGYFYELGAELSHNSQGYSTGLHSDAWSLTDVVWPTGGWTSIQYENDRYTKVNNWYPDQIGTNEREDTHYGGGLRVKEVTNCDGLGSTSCSTTKYLYKTENFDGTDTSENDGYGQTSIPGDSSGVATIEPGTFEDWQDQFFTGNAAVQPYVGYGKVTVIPGWGPSSATYGWISNHFTTSNNLPDLGPYIPPTKWENAGWTYGLNSDDGYIPVDCLFVLIGPKNHNLQMYDVSGNIYGSVLMDQDCNLWDTNLGCNYIYIPGPDAEKSILPNSDDIHIFNTPIKKKKVIPVSPKIAFISENSLESDQMEIVPSLDESQNAEIVSSEGLFLSDDDQMTPAFFFRDLNTNSNFLYFNLYSPKSYRCALDRNGNSIWDLLDMPVGQRTVASYDNDYGRGLLINSTYYNSTGIIIKQIKNDYLSDIQTNFGNGFLKSVWTYLTKINVTTDGVSRVKTFEYNLLNGLANKETEFGNNGKKLITSTKYAYVDKTPMQIDEHMWSQVGEISKYDTLETPSKMVSNNRYVYSNGFFANSDHQWYLSEEYDGVGAEAVKVKTYVDYDDYGNLLSEKDALNQETWIYYGNNNECGLVSNPEGTGVVWNHAYPTCIENAKHQKELLSYDSRGNNVQKTEVSGLVSTTTFDLFNRIDKVFKNSVLIKNFEYYLAGNDFSASNLNFIKENSTIDSSLNKYKITYTKFDGLGKEKKLMVKNGAAYLVQEYSYDSKISELYSKTQMYPDGASYVNLERFYYSRDPLKRIWKSLPMSSLYVNSYIKYLYKSVGIDYSLTEIYDENNQVTKLKYDKFGNLASVTEMNGISTNYAYDITGKILTVTNALNENTNFIYDTHGRLLTRDSPEKGIETYTYYDNGKIWTKTDETGNTVTYEYDPINRLKKIDYPSSTDVIYTFDETGHNGIGKLTTMSDSTGYTQYYYDTLGRLSYETKFIEGRVYYVNYSYDDYDNFNSTTNPIGIKTVYEYDDMNQLSKVKVLTDNVDIKYTTSSVISEITYGNGVVTNYSYNARDWVNTINTRKGTSPLFQRTYRYDNSLGNPRVGNIDTIFTGVVLSSLGSWTGLNALMAFSYDNLYRLSGSDMQPIGINTCTIAPNCVDSSIIYDNVGNRISKDNSILYQYNDPESKNRMTFDGTYYYAYYLDGNLESRTHSLLQSVTTYSWDEDDRLIKVVFPNGFEETYNYDGNGRRVQKHEHSGTTNYIYDQRGNLVFQEFISDLT